MNPDPVPARLGQHRARSAGHQQRVTVDDPLDRDLLGVRGRDGCLADLVAVPSGLREAFSQRSREVEAKLARLVRERENMGAVNLRAAHADVRTAYLAADDAALAREALAGEGFGRKAGRRHLERR